VIDTLWEEDCPGGGGGGGGGGVFFFFLKLGGEGGDVYGGLGDVVIFGERGRGRGRIVRGIARFERWVGSFHVGVDVGR